MTEDQPHVLWFFWVPILSLGFLKSNKLFLGFLHRLSIELLSTTDVELDWIKQLLSFLWVHLSYQPILIFYDNMFVISLTCDHVLHQRTKHIKVDIHFVREIVAKM